MRSIYVKLRGHTSRMLRTTLCMVAVLCAFQAQAQHKVTGKIIDNAGNPIPGATVMVQGTSTGVTADGTGMYSITAPKPTSVLVFSFMGYETKEETVGDRKVINVTLPESAINIESVVSIGYGVKKKTDLTGSVGSIDSELITSKGVVNPLEALQGQIPGVNITTNSSRAGSGFSIQIRGQNSLKAADPLYVVDGIVVDEISFLNPSDIERIDVLKDASSNAIYGSRGSNGVVMIVTKQASSANRDKVTVTYDGYYGVKQVARLPNFMSGDEFQNYRMAAYITAVKNSPTDNMKYEITPGNFKNATINANIWKRYADKDYFDWVNAAFQNGSQQNHFLSVTGNARNTSYVVSMGYQNEEGIFKGDEFKRVSLRGGLTNKIKDFATIGFQSNMSLIDNDRGLPEYINRALSMNPLVKAYDDNGELILYPASTIGLGEPSNGAQYTSNLNPLVDLANTQNNRRGYYILANLFAEVEPIKGLKVKSQFSPTLRTSRSGEYSGANTNKRRTAKTDLAAVTKREYLEYTWDNSVTYAGSKGDHSYDATYVFSIYETRFETTETEVEDLAIPGIYNLGSASKINYSKSNFIGTAMLSHILRANYTYKGKYLLTVSNRWDGSSKLAKKWDSFFAVAGGWRISEEPFLKKADWLSNLKLRASFGYTGNNNIDAYSQFTLPSIKSWYGFGENNGLALGYSPNGIANSELTWEKTREVNVGLDFGFLRGRISGTVDYYNKLSDGLLMSRKLPYEAGIYESKVTDNIGSVRNRGIEVGLSTININKKNVTWSTSFTYSRNKNKIETLYGAKEDDLGNKWFIGQPIDVAYTYISDGVVSAADAKTDWAKRWGVTEGNGKLKDISGPNGKPDGIISSLDRTITGTGFPDWIGNFSSNLKIYNVDFSFSIYANQGRYLYSPFLNDMYNVAGGRQTYKLSMDYYVPENVSLPGIPSDYANAAFPLTPNTDATLPMPNSNANSKFYNTGSKDFQDGYSDMSFVKVKNITLGYTFPKKICDKLRMQSLRIYANVLNPFVFTDYKGYDPEWADAETNKSDGGPSTVVWQFGLNVKF